MISQQGAPGYHEIFRCFASMSWSSDIFDELICLFGSPNFTFAQASTFDQRTPIKPFNKKKLTLPGKSWKTNLSNTYLFFVVSCLFPSPHLTKSWKMTPKRLPVKTNGLDEESAGCLGGNGNQNGGVSCGWVRRYHFCFEKGDMTQSCSWKLTQHKLVVKKWWMSSKFMTFFNKKYKSLQVQCWSFVLKMSHLKFNIPHLDLLAGYLQGPSVPDGGVGSARRGREALQWRTSGGYHCWVTGISYQIWRESGSSFGAGVLIHANWSAKSELEKWFLNCMSAKQDSLVSMIMDMNNMTWHYMISTWKHDNMLTTTTPVPPFLPLKQLCLKATLDPGLLAQLFRFLSQAGSLPNFDLRKFVEKKENSKMENEGFANKFTIDVRPQLYIRSSARFFRTCFVFSQESFSSFPSSVSIYKL